jgi:hypothetical protein
MATKISKEVHLLLACSRNDTFEVLFDFLLESNIPFTKNFLFGSKVWLSIDRNDLAQTLELIRGEHYSLERVAYNRG